MSDTAAEIIAAAFAPEETEKLRRHTHMLGTTETNLISLLASWGSYVRRLEIDRDLAVDDPKGWTPDDLIGALYLRNFVQDGISELNPELAERVEQVVAVFDSQFREITTHDTDRRVRRWAREPVRASWWWERIPRAGPIAHDLSAL